MKKLLISLAVVFTLVMPSQKAHAMDPKTKAFLVMCAYGTVGGSLLGFASMAFGTNSRSIAQGASLGLYAGIIFGGYVVSSHNTAKAGGMNDGYDQQDPYGAPPVDPGYPGGGGGFGAPPPPRDDDGGFFGAPNRAFQINQKLVRNFRDLDTKRENFHVPPVYVSFYNSTF